MSDGAARLCRKRFICSNMASQQQGKKTKTFDLGEFRVDPRRRAITGPSGETRIEPKVMAVLLMLAGRPGEVIMREEFIDSIWAREYGGDESLTRAVSHLRKIFGDANGIHTHIETVPRSGYRLIGQDGPTGMGARPGNQRRLIAAGVIVLFVVALASIFLAGRIGDETPDRTVAGPGSVVLAVLPFDSQSEESKDINLALGLADEILSVLSQSSSISVIAGNSSFRFHGDSKKDLEALTRQLNISHIVDGSVRRTQDSLRVSVNLIDTGTGLVLWSDVVTRPELEIYTIPKVVGTAVQTALGLESIEAGRRTSPPNPKAYETYLQMKALLKLPWGPNLSIAMTGLEEIVEMDPGFSEAWATLALTRLDILMAQPPGDSGLPNVDPPRRLQAARRDANAALAIDPGSIDALLALEIIDYREHATSLIETVNQIQSLLARAPNHPKANLRMGLMMTQVGRFQEAARYLKRAVELDPLANFPGAFYTDALLSCGRMEEARAFMEARNVYQMYQRTYAGLTMRLVAGDFQGARDFLAVLDRDVLFGRHELIEIENVNADSPNTTRLSLLVSRLVTAAEQADSSLDPTIASDLVRAADEGLLLHFYVAQWLAAAGLNEAALDIARERIALGDAFFRESGIVMKPAFRTARRDPRVMELFDVTGQLDYWLESDNWPDYCTDLELPYECKETARQFRENPPVETSSESP